MMKRTILILSLLFGHLWQSHGQVMMLFSSDSLVNITSPLDLDSLFYWFAADQGVTDSLGGTIATNEGVGTWADLSGNNYNVTQTTNGARPVYKTTGGAGSKPCLQFDGSNDFLASAAHFWGSDDLTVFVVMKFGSATTATNEVIAAKWEAVGNMRSWFISGVDSPFPMRFTTSNDGTSGGLCFESFSPKSTTWKLHAAITDTGDNYDWYEDGSTQSSTAKSGTKTAIFNSATTKLSIGSINITSTPALFLKGSISEIIVFSRALTTAERAAIELYLNKKYDLY